MWSSALVPLIAVLVAGAVAWQQATRLDRQSERERWPGREEPDGALGLALGALVTAVALAMLLQMIWLPRMVQ